MYLPIGKQNKIFLPKINLLKKAMEEKLLFFVHFLRKAMFMTRERDPVPTSLSFSLSSSLPLSLIFIYPTVWNYSKSLSECRFRNASLLFLFFSLLLHLAPYLSQILFLGLYTVCTWIFSIKLTHVNHVRKLKIFEFSYSNSAL